MGPELTLSMAGAAAAVHLSQERFRRVWRTWVRDRQFPPPFRQPERGHGTYAWDASDIEVWKANQKLAIATCAPGSNDNAAPKAAATGPDRRLERDRTALRALMSRRRPS